MIEKEKRKRGWKKKGFAFESTNDLARVHEQQGQIHDRKEKKSNEEGIVSFHHLNQITPLKFSSFYRLTQDSRKE